MTLPGGLLTFAQWTRFIVHKGKVPVDPRTMAKCNPHDRSQWMQHDQVASLVEALGDEYEMGFVFAEDDPFWFLDIDKCIDDQGGYSQVAQELMTLFDGCAVERSRSGRGLHIFGTGDCPEHGSRNKELGIEFYTEGRFVALTADVIQGDASTNTTLLMPGFVDRYFPPPVKADAVNWTTQAHPESNPIKDDELLINRMLTSGAAMGALAGKCTLADLWAENITVLSATYPDPQRDYDASAADLALASHLAFWTGCDCERIERLMRRSKLARDKWDRREHGAGYLKDTIIKAVSGCQRMYGQGDSQTPPPPPPPPPGESTVTRRSGFQLLTPENQLEYFKGCVYIRDIHRAWIPDGSFLKPDQFRSYFGGYVFALDAMGDKTTKNAWEAFTENQAFSFPKVASSAFRPRMQPGVVFMEEGIQMVNTYVPIDTPAREGDPGPFLDWLQKILPDPRDREILLSWMAAIVQNPGLKSQWGPMIQGCEGNGKTAITMVLGHAIGWRYTHLPNADDLAGNGLKFNGWMQNKLLIVIEEIYTNDRHHVVDAMKVMTNQKMEIQRKGGDQITADTPFNTLAMTNHKDAMRITWDQRRWAVFYCAQQSASDLTLHSMDGDYFPALYKWLEAEGYEIMNHYLHNYQVSDKFNPFGTCHRAPTTSSTPEAVHVSLGGVEQEIVNAIEEGRPGFAGGWVSTIMLSRLLDQLRLSSRIPQNKRREIMRALGYDWHPALVDGRVNNPIAQEGGKPKLFCQIGHLNYNNLKSAAEVMRAYCKAQNYSPQQEDQHNGTD